MLKTEVQEQEVKKPDQNTQEDTKSVAKSRWQICVKHYADWLKAAEEDDEMALGNQWTQEDRQALADAKRPCLTFNRIKPVLKILSGYQRENSPRIKVSPEGGEDRVFSEVFDKAIRKISRLGKLDYHLDNQFDEGNRAGSSWIEAVLNYDRDPIRGELRWVDDGPWQIMVDPDCNQYDINAGAEYLFKYCKYSKSKLKTMFPDLARKIDGITAKDDDFVEDPVKEGDSDDYGNRPTANSQLRINSTDVDPAALDEKLLYKEYWYKKYVTRYFFVDDDENICGSTIDVDKTRKPFSSEAEAQAEITRRNLAGPRKIFNRQIPEMHVTMFVAGEQVKDGKSSFEPFYSGFPFFRYIAEHAPNAKKEEWRVQGLVRALKDPQREKNKSKSANLHILSTQANSGWIGDKNALVDADWKKLEKFGSVPGLTVKKKPGSYLEEIQPKGPNTGQIQREQAADEEFKQISNINPDALGIQDKTTSGRAISMRIRQAVLAFAPVFSNYSYTKEIIGSFILQMLPSLLNAKKLERIIGADYMLKARSELYPNGLQIGDLAAMLQLVQDSRYDIEVHEADNTKTIRSEIFEQLTELAKIPQGQALPIELILDYMDIGNADEIKGAIKAEKERLLAMQPPKAAPGV